jgi:hypothetical protein
LKLEHDANDLSGERVEISGQMVQFRCVLDGDLKVRLNFDFSGKEVQKRGAISASLRTSREERKTFGEQHDDLLTCNVT